MGAAVPAPSLLLEASRAKGLCVEGPKAERVHDVARRFLDFHGVDGGAHVHVRRTLPAHAGLGSGTQLALATARALAELYGLPADAPLLARAVGRARRSAIGTWVFAGGGFVLEGGRRDGSEAPAPLLMRLPFPPSWRCVVVVPPAAPGLSGDAETAAFAHLPPPPERDVERVAHLVLMQMLPALADGELAAFGAALTTVQQINGRWFAPAQGGAFAPGASGELVRRLVAWGAPGVGQSSWGPAVYAIVEGDAAAHAIAERVRSAASGALVFAGAFSNTGASVRRSA
jgi:beta-RFAP synthase